MKTRKILLPATFLLFVFFYGCQASYTITTDDIKGYIFHQSPAHIAGLLIQNNTIYELEYETFPLSLSIQPVEKRGSWVRVSVDSWIRNDYKYHKSTILVRVKNHPEIRPAKREWSFSESNYSNVDDDVWVIEIDGYNKNKYLSIR